MEALTRLVADSLARHGLDRPVDPRRLQWSRWFHCDSPHSLLVVPSKPGIFALAEEVLDLGRVNAHVGTAAPGCPAEQSSASVSSAATADGISALGTRDGISTLGTHGLLGGAALQRCDSSPIKNAASAAEVPTGRMLAVLQFAEDDDMAFVLDRMFIRINPMRDRLASGRCFLRFVVIEDQAQRRSICTALNQWMLSSAEKATGLGADFQSSLELAPVTDRVSTDRVGRTLLSDSADSAQISATLTKPAAGTDFSAAPMRIDSGAAKNLHCPHSLPSGF
jgi:hypothetical protein